ncbi:general stress protein [Chungangia koreensis]|uniref:General stress protein n=1 Tax=Chungangia koreensis TaxID=752657 RepID=A0ABV8X0X8_9LACT
MENRVLKIALSEEDMYAKLDELTSMGFEENDIHVLSKKPSELRVVRKYSDVQVHDLGNMKSKMMSLFGGNEASNGNLEGIGFSDQEIRFINNGLDQGGIILFSEAHNRDMTSIEEGNPMMDRERWSDGDGSNELNTAEEIPFHVENNYDEPIDRFRHGQTFQNDDILVREEDHVSFSMEEDPIVRNNREELFGAEKVYDDNDGSDEPVVNDDYRMQDEQSPGIDPNLGPAPFGPIDEATEHQSRRPFNQNL